MQFKIMYLLLSISSVLIAFFKPKQEYIASQEAEIDNLNSEVSDLNVAVTHYVEKVDDQSKEIERLGSTAQKILNNVNHELRLPVGNVMNFAEMLSDGLSKYNDDDLKHLSKEVHDNSTRLSSMILNMLDLATLDAEKIELRKSMINFSELVEDRIQVCKKLYLKDKNLSIEYRIHKNLLINIDPNYIRQTVDNLIINAINFSDKGTIKISVLPISQDPVNVEFVIQDEGIGIPQKDLFDIFTPFKLGSNTESNAEGRGVGLALCKRAIEAHDGKITAESPKGKGARFSFILSSLG